MTNNKLINSILVSLLIILTCICFFGIYKNRTSYYKLDTEINNNSNTSNINISSNNDNSKDNSNNEKNTIVTTKSNENLQTSDSDNNNSQNTTTENIFVDTSSDIPLETSIDNELGILKTQKSKTISDIYKYTIAKDSALLNVPLISQLPDLYNGCEVTSLAMMLNFTGKNISKNQLAHEISKDNTPVSYDSDGNISVWGDPSVGFVGSISGGDGVGFAVDPGPLTDLSYKYLSSTINLTGASFVDIEKVLTLGHPVVAWITMNFGNPNDSLVKWHTTNGKLISGTFDSHTVLIIGYDSDNVYYNNPFTNEQNSQDKSTFIKVWKKMGSKAISYT